MVKKKKVAIGANIVSNPFANRTYNKSFTAQRDSANYIKGIANTKKIGGAVSGITTGVLGAVTGNPELIKSGIKDTIGTVSSTPLDMSSIQNIYGSSNMENLPRYSGGIDPTVGAGLSSLVDSYQFGMSKGGIIPIDTVSTNQTIRQSIQDPKIYAAMYNKGVNNGYVKDDMFGKQIYATGVYNRQTPQDKAVFQSNQDNLKLQRARQVQANPLTRNPNYDLNGFPISNSTALTTPTKFDDGGLFPAMPKYITQPDSITSMLPMKEYSNIPTLATRATPYLDALRAEKKPLISGGKDLLGNINPLSIGSKLQNTGMDEYGVIENDAAYIAGSILNPIGAFANWAGNGFNGNTYMKDKRGQKIQNMTAENISNTIGEKNTMQYGVDYDRLNNYNNKGRVSSMNMAKGGMIPLSANAGELVGPTHAQGGIDITPQVEAEGGEVLNKTPQGDTQVFSEQTGFADAVKPLLQQKGIYEQELTNMLPIKKVMLDTFAKETDGLRRASIGRNLEKVNNDIFKYTQIVQQIDVQVQQLFTQQQEQNGNNSAPAGMQQGMAFGGEIPPIGDNTQMYDENGYPMFNILNNNTVPYSYLPNLKQDEINSTIGIRNPIASQNLPNLRKYNQKELLGNKVLRNWQRPLDINTNTKVMQLKPGWQAPLRNYNVPMDESLLTNTPNGINTTPVVNNTPRTRNPIDLSKLKGKFKNIQDVAIPAIELAQQMQIANKMENTKAPQANMLSYNPLDVRYTPDYELNKLQSGINTTVSDLRKNSSNPYYANALRANIMKDNINTTGNIIDKTNKENLNIIAQNNAGFNRVAEANNTLRFNNKQINYEKAIGDLERRSGIIGNTTNRAIEFANNKRQYGLDLKRLSIEGAKYQDSFQNKYTDAAINGTLADLIESNAAKTTASKNSIQNGEEGYLQEQNGANEMLQAINTLLDKGQKLSAREHAAMTKQGFKLKNGKYSKS